MPSTVPLIVPETPATVDQLDLMRQLESYAAGTATWEPDGRIPGPELQRACRTLHTHLCNLVKQVLAPILDRVTTREMEAFTLHDRVHGLKVAHLMWHILDPQRRERLSPAEIALLITTAHLHDLGMGLSPEERASRLAPNSDLWLKLDLDPSLRMELDRLRSDIADPDLPESRRITATRQLIQAEESLLCADTRERHATPQRYGELLVMLSDCHRRDPTNIPDIEQCLSFDGDSFRVKLIDICVSHNEDADVLVALDKANPGRRRFPRDYPIGRCTADIHVVAAALRLADILDFDRERTPPALFHYLLPGSLRSKDDRSTLEWRKHLAISNWQIDREAVVYRGRCNDPIIHHAIVLFARAIEDEIATTRATFQPLSDTAWPFSILPRVIVDIHEEGYRYLPYRFELDDQRVYELLMGGAIYQEPLAAVRELIQNAVDACKFRDALTKLAEPHVSLSAEDRIVLRYEAAPSGGRYGRLTIADTGIGMDAWIIERYFLRVGQSFYKSQEFNKTRVDFRGAGVDFAPVSEFGIGFLAAFLLADHVEVTTAMAEPLRGDSRRRVLAIDGPTRLIRIVEDPNEGPMRLRGTGVSLSLKRPFEWQEIAEYVRQVCVDLPYRLRLEYVAGSETTVEHIDALPLLAVIPEEFSSATTRIPIFDEDVGLEGEIALAHGMKARESEQRAVAQSPITVTSSKRQINTFGWLSRGGFRVGNAPGLPMSFYASWIASARIRLRWETTKNKRYLPTTLAREHVADRDLLGDRVLRCWLSYLLSRADQTPDGFLWGYELNRRERNPAWVWLQRWDALELYKLARTGWIPSDDKHGDLRPEWEESHGPMLPLPLGSSSLSRILLDFVLPRICVGVMDSRTEIHVCAPKQGWRDSLRNWHTYVAQPQPWSPFLRYTEDITDCVLYVHVFESYFNSAFRDRLDGWTEHKLQRLKWVLKECMNGRDHSRRVKLSLDDNSLLRSASEQIGDLQVRSIFGRCSVADLAGR